MKNRMRQILVVLIVLVTISVNVLANALPINGLNTGEISDRFKVYFVPAGYVFSIWGVIYLGLLAYAIFQALPSQRENPHLQSTGWWVVLGGLANSIWIFLWHYQQFIGTLAAMLVLLASLIAVYLRLRDGKGKVSGAETWAVRVPFSIYLGWITVATVANVTSLLDFLNWNGWGISPESWMLIVLAVVLLIAVLMNLRQRDIAYALVILWALAGIGVKFPQAGMVTIATWVTFGMVALTIVFSFLMKSRKT
jgi:TspO/MBR family